MTNANGIKNTVKYRLINYLTKEVHSLPLIGYMFYSTL